MKLYYAPGACSLSPHIVLCEAGLPAELVRVDLATKQTEHDDDFRRVNPLGYVPALELDDGEVLLEGPAIVQYLADLVPEANLAPRPGDFQRYRLQQWLNFISSELHKGFGALFRPDLPEAAKTLFRQTLGARLSYAADHLAARPYLLGDDFSVADAYLFTVLSWRDYVGMDLAPWPGLLDYADRIAARSAVQQALRAEGLTR